MEPRPPVLGSQSFSHWTTSFLLFFKKKKSIYLFIYLFLAALGLCCCEGFSLVAVSGGYSGFIVGCAGFSPQWLLLMWSTGPRAQAQQVGPVGSEFVVNGLGCSAVLGDLPDPGREPVSPALVGGFFSTEPPGKPSFFLLF